MVTLNINGSRLDISSREDFETQAFLTLSYLDYQEFSEIINNSDKVEEAYEKGYQQAATENEEICEHYKNIIWDLYECLESIQKSLKVDRLTKPERERIVKNIGYQLKETYHNM